MAKLNCFCAFCKVPRTIYRKKALNGVNYIQALSLSSILSFIFWGKLDPKALIFFVMTLMFTEIGILIRRRAAAACPHCGFDPYLYLKDQNAACEKVKIHLEQRQADPDVWLGKKPPLRFSKRSSKNSTREIQA